MSLTNALKQLSQEHNVTLFVTLLVAFKILLFYYSGQSDIIVGTPFANRQQVETKGLVGCFINTLPIRTYLGGNPSFRELLSQVRACFLAAYEQQQFPFIKLVEALQPKRDPINSLLYQVMFNFLPPSDLELSNLTVQSLEIETKTAEFDWDIYLQETTLGSIKGKWCYKTDLFDNATIARAATQFMVLLESLVTNPDQSLADMSLVFQRRNPECDMNLHLQIDSYTQTSPTSSSDSVSSLPPRTPCEEAIAAILCNVLGLEQVGIHDNFFTLGGHSLLAIQVIYRLRETFKVELPLRLLFEEPTVAELAANINPDLTVPLT